MTAVVQSAADRFRRRLAEPEILLVPGAADAITARVIEEAGFSAVYATGAGFANASLGVPDLGLVTLSEVVAHVQRIVDVIDIPLIADADTGYGGVLNVYRTVQQLERAGVAAIQLEDQAMPKRCGHFDGNRLVPEEEMVQKLRAALAARRDPQLVIIARTDGLQVEGLDSAIRRARAYRGAGADMIFVEAPRTLEELAVLPGAIDAPLVANMVEGGKTPLVDAAQLEAMGFRMALFANTALRVGVKAVRTAMLSLRASGGTAQLVDDMITWDERQELIGLPRFEAQETEFLGPSDPAVLANSDQA